MYFYHFLGFKSILVILKFLGGIVVIFEVLGAFWSFWRFWGILEVFFDILIILMSKIFFFLVWAIL